MGMQFRILGSSSTGNSGLLVTENCRVLIDAGFSSRRIAALLEECGEKLENIDAVFLTHEHNDHSAGLTGISRLPNIKAFANYSTAQAVQSSLKRRANWQIFETGQTFEFRDLEITSFPIPHDAYDPVGFVISQGGSDLFNPRRTIAWCIDLGHIPRLVRERARRADLLVLEANYETRLLDEDPRRPWSVKQRIKSRHGHLSNETVRDFIYGEERPNWKKVYLAHLSRDCNDVSILADMFCGKENSDERGFVVSIVDPNSGASPPYNL